MNTAKHEKNKLNKVMQQYKNKKMLNCWLKRNTGCNLTMKMTQMGHQLVNFSPSDKMLNLNFGEVRRDRGAYVKRCRCSPSSSVSLVVSCVWSSCLRLRVKRSSWTVVFHRTCKPKSLTLMTDLIFFFPTSLPQSRAALSGHKIFTRPFLKHMEMVEIRDTDFAACTHN